MDEDPDLKLPQPWQEGRLAVLDLQAGEKLGCQLEAVDGEQDILQPSEWV